MKRTFAISLIVAVLLTFISCNNSLDGPAGSLISLNDLKDYRAEISSAKSIGIKSLSRGITKGEDVARALSRGEHQNYLVTSDNQSNDHLTTVTFSRVSGKEHTEGRKDNIIAEERDSIGTISFFSNPGFTYSLLLNDVVVIEEITDNSPLDKSPLEGVIMIEGLEPGQLYNIAYKGNGKEEVITQDDLNGMIDKVYVCGNYTFISFVAIGRSERPSDENLEYGPDGISTYDKTGYYTSSDRKSFIIDNSTGLIYPIKGFKIERLEGGCIRTDDEHTVYDFRINENGDMEIYPIISNDTINIYHVMKDKYGQVYVANDRINGYYESTNTLFYIVNSSSMYVTYAKTSQNEVIEIKDDYSGLAQKVGPNNTRVPITESDTFDIIDYVSGAGYYMDAPYKVVDGVMFFGSFKEDTSTTGQMFDWIYCVFLVNQVTKQKVDFVYEGNYLSTDFVRDFDVVLSYKEKEGITVYYGVTKAMFDFITGENTLYPSKSSFCEKKELMENCSLSDDHNSVLTYGPFGNTYYDIVVERNKQGEVAVNFYQVGTYEKPQIKITLQPINR